MAISTGIADESPSEANKSTGQSFLALTPIPTILLGPALRILLVSASFLSLHNLAAEECIGVGIYEVADAKGLLTKAIRYVIETALAMKRVYATDAMQAVGNTATTPRC